MPIERPARSKCLLKKAKLASTQAHMHPVLRLASATLAWLQAQDLEACSAPPLPPPVTLSPMRSAPSLDSIVAEGDFARLLGPDAAPLRQLSGAPRLRAYCRHPRFIL